MMTENTLPFKFKNQETEKNKISTKEFVDVTTTEKNGNERLEEICNVLFEKDPGMLILHIT